MGCGTSNNAELQKLEAELTKLRNEKNEALKTNIIPQLPPIKEEFKLPIEIMQGIDKEQNEASEVIHVLINYLGNAGQLLNEVSVKSKITELSKLEGLDKVIKYLKTRQDETSLENRLCEEVKNVGKRMESIDNEVKDSINKGIVELSSLIPDSSEHNPQFEEFKKISEDYSIEKSTNISNVTLRVLNRMRLEGKINKLKWELLKDVRIENEAIHSLRQIEEELKDALKESYNNLYDITDHHGYKEDEVKVILLKDLINPEFVTDSVLSIVNSVTTGLRNLVRLEKEKSRILSQKAVDKELAQLNQKLSDFLENFGTTKEKSLSSLNRILGSESGFLKMGLLKNVQLAPIINIQVAAKKEGLLDTAKTLRSRATTVLDRATEHDKQLLAMTDQLSGVQSKLDDLEIQLDEFLSQEIRELTRTVNDNESREKLEKIKDSILNTSSETIMNIIDHINKFSTKFNFTKEIEHVREKIREIHKEDIHRTRAEMQEKINALEDRKSILETENARMESNIKGFQERIEKGDELVNQISQINSTKEIEIGNYKNLNMILNDEIKDLRINWLKLEEENSDLNKENRSLKKIIKDKENEIRILRDEKDKSN